MSCGCSLLQALYNTPSNFAGRYIVEFGKSMGEYPGAETPVTLDEPDVLDAFQVLSGVGAGGLLASCWLEGGKKAAMLDGRCSECMQATLHSKVVVHIYVPKVHV